jgi:hypothetical protein
MPFQPGHAKIPGSGRQKGQVGLRTQLARDGLRSAIQICREGGTDPISIMMNAARVLNTIGLAFMPHIGDNPDRKAIKKAILEMPPNEVEFIRKFLVDGAMVAHKAAEFGYAKLQRIDYVGDAPAVASVESKMVFVLNVDAERPGRPVTIDGNGSMEEHRGDHDDDEEGN